MLTLNKALVPTIIGLALTLLISGAEAANRPCSGKMGGVAYCVNGKFLCNNGQFSRSKKVCNLKVYGSRPQARTRKQNRNKK